MTPGAELERQIIGALTLKPELIESADGLSAQDFLDKTNKLAFNGITEFWEDSHPETIDEFFLSKKTGLSLADILKCVFRRFRPPIPNEGGHVSERSDAGQLLCT